MNMTTVVCPSCGGEVLMTALIQNCGACGYRIMLRPCHRTRGNDPCRVIEYLNSIGATIEKYNHLLRTVVPLRYEMFDPEIIEKVDE